MRIDEIRIFKYKSVKKPQIVRPTGGTTLFIGKNNSGKSTVLDSLFQFFRPLQDPERFADSEARIEADCEFDSRDRSALGKLGLTSLPEKIVLQLVGDSFSYKTADEKKQIPPELSHFLVQKTIRIGALRDLDFVKMRKLFEEFRTGWPKAFSLFMSKLQIFFPEIKTPSKLFQEGRDGVETTVKEFGKKRSIERLGLGFRHLFILLMYYYHPRYDVILIDEPEIHLHPQMVKRLADIFFAHTNEKQVFITTHSPLFVQPEHLDSVYRVVREEPLGTVLYSSSGSSLDSTRLVQELNADNGEMFLSDHILLVEGVSDRIFIRKILQRWYESSKDIKVVPVHGKENFDTYAELLSAFHIPYSIMIDRDGFQDVSIHSIQRVTKNPNFEQATQELIKKGICVLPFGSLENHYPKRFKQLDLPKPLFALRVADQLTEEDLTCNEFLPIKNLLDRIIAEV